MERSDDLPLVRFIPHPLVWLRGEMNTILVTAMNDGKADEEDDRDEADWFCHVLDQVAAFTLMGFPCFWTGAGKKRKRQIAVLLVQTIITKVNTISTREMFFLPLQNHGKDFRKSKDQKVTCRWEKWRVRGSWSCVIAIGKTTKNWWMVFGNSSDWFWKQQKESSSRF